MVESRVPQRSARYLLSCHLVLLWGGGLRCSCVLGVAADLHPLCVRALPGASQSRSRLEKHLAKLIPTLYRYTFDPNPRIASAMRSVWDALVPEPKKALAAHLPQVMDNLREGARCWLRHQRISTRGVLH